MTTVFQKICLGPLLLVLMALPSLGVAEVSTFASAECRTLFESPEYFIQKALKSKRRIGLELEFAGLELTDVIKLIQLRFGGQLEGGFHYVNHETPVTYSTNASRNGSGDRGFRFQMITIEGNVLRGRYRKSRNIIQIEDHVFRVNSESEARAMIAQIHLGDKMLVQQGTYLKDTVIGDLKFERDGNFMELITEPLAPKQLVTFRKIHALLTAMGAQGTESGRATGLHYNISFSPSDVEKLRTWILAIEENREDLTGMFQPSPKRANSHQALPSHLIKEIQSTENLTMTQLKLLYARVHGKNLGFNPTPLLNGDRNAVETRIANAEFLPESPATAHDNGLILLGWLETL